jgi:hypothetical protein
MYKYILIFAVACSIDANASEHQEKKSQKMSLTERINARLAKLSAARERILKEQSTAKNPDIGQQNSWDAHLRKLSRQATKLRLAKHRIEALKPSKLAPDAQAGSDKVSRIDMNAFDWLDRLKAAFEQ